MEAIITPINQQFIYTFGYGNRRNHAELIKYLEHFKIKFLIDIRVSPRAWSRQWYGSQIEKVCLTQGVQYYSYPDLGNTSGTAVWIPPDQEAANQAIETVVNLAKVGSILLLCAEKNPERCHRKAIAQTLSEILRFSIHHLD